MKEEDKTFTTVFIIMIVIIFLGGIFIYSYSKNDKFKNIANSVVNKNLESSDVTIDSKESLTGVSITVTPKVDVKDITIGYEILNSNGNIIKEGTLKKYNLSKNQTYEYDLDLSFSNILKGRKIRYWLESGTKK